MKKILLLLTAMLVTMATEAKVVKILMSDGEWKIYSSSQLSAIDFNADGTVSVVGYDGELLTTLDPSVDKITIGDDYEIIYVKERTLTFDAKTMMEEFGGGSSESLDLIQGILFDRDVTQVSFAYPSIDPYGNPITQSGMMIIPQDILNKEAKSEGILLYNHTTLTSTSWTPSNGYLLLEPIFLCNPLTPNFIIVEADLYGFGTTDRFPQAFVQGHANEHASLDCLLAARSILEAMNVEEGPLTFNIGYSTGGYEALSTQRCRDMEYADRISFTKTFAGGSPSDMKVCYREMIARDSIDYSCVLALLISSINEIHHLGKDYSEFFLPDIAAKIEPVILSKKYNHFEIDSVLEAGSIIHNILTPTYCDLDSPESVEMQALLETLSLNRDWVPDPSQKIFIMHMHDDDVIPLPAGEALVDYLKANGMKTSIIPGRGNLEADFNTRDKGHISGFMPFMIKVIANITTWTVMYSDGVLKPEWQKVLEEQMEEAANNQGEAAQPRQLTPMQKCEAELYKWLNIKH